MWEVWNFVLSYAEIHTLNTGAMMNEPVSAIMTKNVVTVKPNDTLDKVKNILFDKHFHHIPVVEGPRNKLLGIITSFDLMKLDRRFEDYSRIRVSEVMTTNIVTLESHEKIGAAAMIFLRKLFHGLPIVNQQMELVGIVTTHDVLKYEFDKEYPNDTFELAYRVNEQD